MEVIEVRRGTVRRTDSIRYGIANKPANLPTVKFEGPYSVAKSIPSFS